VLKGRLLDSALGDAFSNLAVEEALFRELALPVLRVWKNQKSVVIGRAQLAKFETDLDYCAEKSVPVVRRFTAGGAVYNGPGNLNWSFFVPRGSEAGGVKTSATEQVFESFANLVVAALEGCGVVCRFKPPNSIVNEVGKVSGMAAYLSKEAALCHGTLLLNADLAEVQRLTTPSKEVLSRRYPRSKHTEVSNCGADGAKFTAQLAMVSGYQLVPDALTTDEMRLASELATSKYRTGEWNLGDPFSSDDL
jgi:lipoate---protein ligase